MLVIIFIQFGNAYSEGPVCWWSGCRTRHSIIENVDPSIWFPVVNPTMLMNTVGCIGLKFKRWFAVAVVASLLRTEVHTAGAIVIIFIWMNGDEIDIEVELNISSKLY
jgi:hypothetical protein